MEDLQRTHPYKYPYERCPSSSSAAAACLPHYHGNVDTNEGNQIQTLAESMKFVEPGPCNDDDAVAAVIFDKLSNRPHDYGLPGTASLGPLAQLHQTAADDSSQAVTQCWQKFGGNIGYPFETLTCSSCSLLSYRNPNFSLTRSGRGKKAAAGGGGQDYEASKQCIGNAHVHKLVERERRSRMKELCSTLLSVLPDEYRKARPSNVRDKFQTVRVRRFGPGIQVTVNILKDQIAFSSLLSLLEEAGVEVASATVNALNDRFFNTIHLKLLGLGHFDTAVLQGRIDRLMNDNLPKVSVTK